MQTWKEDFRIEFKQICCQIHLAKMKNWKNIGPLVTFLYLQRMKENSVQRESGLLARMQEFLVVLMTYFWHPFLLKAIPSSLHSVIVPKEPLGPQWLLYQPLPTSGRSVQGKLGWVTFSL